MENSAKSLTLNNFAVCTFFFERFACPKHAVVDVAIYTVSEKWNYNVHLYFCL